MKKINVILIFCFFIAGLFSVAVSAEYKSEFRIGNGGEPESLDPHFIKWPAEERIHMTLFENLTSINPEDATALPGVAESWEISPDGKDYTFKLRKTVWSDGVPITAHTFVKSWLRMLKPSIKAPLAWLPCVFIVGAENYNKGQGDTEKVKIKALDDYTLQVELVGRMPFFLTSLSHPSFSPVPIHLIEKYGLDWTKPGRIVSNGPFILQEYNANDKSICVPNPEYWDKENVKLTKIIFYSIEDSKLAYSNFLKGELDWITNIPSEKLASALKRSDSYNIPSFGTYYYIFNTNKKPFNDSKVRKALSIAINRQELIKKVTQAGEHATTAFVPPIPGYKTITGNPEDLLMAKKLLEEAGYPGGRGFPEFRILYNTYRTGIHKITAEFIQQQWKDNLGIRSSLKDYEWNAFLEIRKSNSFDVARGGWLGDYFDPRTFLDLFVSNSKSNDGRYNNKEYDQLIEASNQETDLKKRMDFFSQAEEILITRDQAVMPIYYFATKGMIDTKKWGGWYPNIMNHHPTKNIFLK